MEVAVHITPQDIAEGEDLDFEEKEEHWNIYKLSDGTKYATLILICFVLLQGNWFSSFIVIVIPLFAFFYFLYHTSLRQYNPIVKFVNITTLKLQATEQTLASKLTCLPYPLEIFIGLSLIVFPEPTGVSDIVGLKLVEDGIRKKSE
jgi:hypothetical protein